jgi:RHS repeat-associated protein
MPDRTLAEASSAKEDYTGHERDAETSLHYAGARYYMSALGRWTSGEPLLNGDPRPLLNDQRQVLLGVSPYNYSLNNPANLRDPDGRCPICWDIADIGFAAHSVSTAWSDPSASNIGWATFDVVAAAAPVVPSSGYFRGGAKLLSAADDAVGATKQLRHATGAAENVLKGIDLSFVSPNSRFGRAFYGAESGMTAVREAGGKASHVIRYSLALKGQKVLDFTNPEVAAKWGYEGGLGRKATQAIAKRARKEGFNAVAFPAVKGKGTNYAIFDNFEEILQSEMVSPAAR